MGWDIEEPKKKNNNNKVFKILTVFIILLIVLICVIIGLLYYIKANTYVLTVDEVSKKFSNGLIKEYNDTTYYNIRELAEILEYDFHEGEEYKEYAKTKNNDKCYIVDKNKNETASFYLNSNKVCKLRLGETTENYKVFNSSDNTTRIDSEFYAPIDAIETAFDITIESNPKKLEILTLPYIVQTIDKRINPDEKNPVYNSLLDEDFENQKALLYGYIVACNKESELYNVKSLDGQKEVISDKYKKITFLEETKEFLVTNSENKVGIVNEDGQSIIEQIYDSIKIINISPKLYLVENNQKYGVIDETGKVIVHAEYDKVGVDSTKFSDLENQYVFLNSVIPVQKDQKHGLFTVKGEKILDVIYNDIGCEDKSIRLGENENKSVTPVVAIEKCNGIVVKNGQTYDLFLLDTKQLVSLKVTSIYSIRESGKDEYYMVYKEKEMNLIENLIKLGYIKEDSVGTNENVSESTNNQSNEINTNNNSNVVNATNTTNTINTTTPVTNQTPTNVNASITQ